MTVHAQKTSRREVSRSREWLVLIVAILSLMGCDAELEILNAAPRVTWVAVQPPIAGESVAEITVWVHDVEGDPVDLTVRVTVGGVEKELVLLPGGHGLTGLTTQAARFDENGQPHLEPFEKSDPALCFTP